ncbi:VOC family protein [Mucilaginibacter sp. PAMB04274]|uniref:VOC family protein n=1 Tax=Mucilaginibacter sp. PAMB04274 TaxID=3138568 RepID=UPI0031F66331
MQKITPFLWFNDRAQEAVDFYASIFKDLKITNTLRNGQNGPGEQGSILTISFELFGQEFTILNGGPGFVTPTMAVSFFVKCESQEEVDQYWDNLLEGGQAMQCGWLTDKFGVTWQIVPTLLMKLMGDKDANKAQKVMQAMMKMVKLDIPTLQKAYDEA